MTNQLTFSVTSIDDPGWMSFIERRPDSHLFHHPVWSNFLAKTYGYRPYLAEVKDELGQVTAGLPFMELSAFPSNHRWVSLPFSDFCPPLAAGSESLEVLKKGLMEEARRKNIAEVELRWQFNTPDLFQSSEHVVTSTRLFSDPARVQENIKSHDFRKVKLGPKRGIEIERATSLEAMKVFYGLHVKTRRRLGVPVQPWHFFQQLSEQIIQPGMGFISLARQGQDYLAGIVFLTWKNTLIYKFSATSQRGRDLAAAYPLTWDAIKWGCENGYLLLDWGRSDAGDEGLRNFKKHWASQERELIYSRSKKNGAVLLNRMKPVVKAIISNSPEWVCRMSGEFLYRYFG